MCSIKGYFFGYITVTITTIGIHDYRCHWYCRYNFHHSHYTVARLLLLPVLLHCTTTITFYNSHDTRPPLLHCTVTTTIIVCQYHFTVPLPLQCTATTTLYRYHYHHSVPIPLHCTTTTTLYRYYYTVPLPLPP